MTGETVTNQGQGGQTFDLAKYALTGSHGTMGTAQTTSTGPAYPPGYDTGDSTSKYQGSGATPNNYVAQHPNLPAPRTGDATPGTAATTTPAPLTQAQQEQVLEEYDMELANDVDELEANASPPLTQDQSAQLTAAVQSGTPPSDPTLAALFNSAVGRAQLAIQTANMLPSTWTAASPTTSSSWQPVATLGPYTSDQQATINNAFNTELQYQINEAVSTASPPLTQTQITALQNAITNLGPAPGDDPIVSTIYYAALGQATTNIQEEFNLPGTWFPGDTDTADVTPTGTSGTSATTGIDAKLQLGNNAIALATQAQTAVQNLLGTMPPNNPQAVLMADFLKAVSTAIDNMQRSLQQLQQANATLEDDLTKAKMSEQAGQITDNNEMIQNQEKQYQQAVEQRNSHSKMADVMKILGPIVAAVCMVIGAIAAPTGAGVAVFAVGVALLAYSIADSQCGLTQKAVSAFKNMLNSLGSPMNIVVGATIGAVLAAVLVGCCIMNPGAGVDIGTQIAFQATEQVSIQVAFTAIMASNLIQEAAEDIAGPLVSALGGGQMAQMIVSALVMVVIMIAIVAAASKAGSMLAQGFGTEAAQAAASGGANAAAQNAAPSIGDDADVVMTRNPLSEANQILDQGEASGNGVADNAANAANGANASPAAKDAIASVKQQIKDFFSNIKEAMQDNPTRVVAAVALVQSMPQGVSMADNIMQGMYAQEIATILKQIGNITGDIEVLKEMIQQLSKIINNIASGLSDTSADIGNLTSFAMGLFDKLNSTLSGVANAGVPG